MRLILSARDKTRNIDATFHSCLGFYFINEKKALKNENVMA